MTINKHLPNKAHCLNLTRRTDRKEYIEMHWKDILPVEFLHEDPAWPKGIEGNFMSHIQAVKACAAASRASATGEPGRHGLIIEDDAMPCRDFKWRLEQFMEELPADWDMFLLGHWPMHTHQKTQVTEHIWQALTNVPGAHCYMVNKAFAATLIDFLEAIDYKHMDHAARLLEAKYKVYMAIPSFAYQDSNFSDNTGTPTDTSRTKMYFKDRL